MNFLLNSGVSAKASNSFNEIGSIDYKVVGTCVNSRADGSKWKVYACGQTLDTVANRSRTGLLYMLNEKSTGCASSKRRKGRCLIFFK